MKQKELKDVIKAYEEAFKAKLEESESKGA
jgi:hypothetical protein